MVDGDSGRSTGSRGSPVGVDDPEPGLAPFSLVDDQPLGERVDVIQADAGSVGDDLGPVVPGRRVVGGRHQPEVLGAVVGDDEVPAVAPPAASPRSWVDPVLDPVAAGLDDREIPVGVVGSQRAHLGGHLRLEVHEDRAVVLGPAHGQVEAGRRAPRRPGRRRPGRCPPRAATAGTGAWPRRPGRRTRWRCRRPRPTRTRCPRATRATRCPGPGRRSAWCSARRRWCRSSRAAAGGRG